MIVIVEGRRRFGSRTHNMQLALAKLLSKELHAASTAHILSVSI
jgi:hypothetical protein